ncbi:MAG: hypothetical protein ACREUQ_10345, partial [Burkholderiales bacterium]
HKLIVELMAKGQQFCADDRRALYNLIGQLMGEVIPRYRKLAESGQIELSTSPHYHPIGPLMLDLRSARQAQPGIILPEVEQYCGGRSRLAWHIQSALASHAQRFGAPARGMWPAEGAISTDFLQTLAVAGMQWAASGEGVLVNTLSRTAKDLPPRNQYLYRPYRIGTPGHQIVCFFRDDKLSDAVGFEYAKWHGRDAVAHLIGELDRIRLHADAGDTPVVSIILDGENAWEFYPYNGYYFLHELYEALEQHSAIRTWTCSGYLDMLNALPEADREQRLRDLPEVVAGSWVYGNFATWIGSPEKNLAWNLLCSVKQRYDLVMASDRLTPEEQALAQRLLAACEGSDWFWWFGDYNPQNAVASFDQLFRGKLAQLYKTLHLPVPDQLGRPISTGGGHAEMGGSMRRAS